MKSWMMIAGVAMTACAAQGAQKPNILFIAVDDLKPMLGCYGDKNVLSPNIDRLAENGTVFLNNACQQSVCGPTRASLMTGTYPDTTRVYDLKTKMRTANPNTLTLPEYLKNNGYETTGCGKVYDHNCVDTSFDAPSWTQPQLMNVDDRYYADGMKGGNYRDPETSTQYKELNRYLKTIGIEMDDVKKDQKAFSAAMLKFPKAKPVTECRDLPDDSYDDGAYANCAVEQMEQLAKGGKPFFLAVGFRKPHLPFVAPKKYWDLYDPANIELAPYQKKPEGAPDFAMQDSWELRSSYSGIPGDGPIPDEVQRNMIHGYRACVSYVDAQIGKVLAKLDELGLSKNTIVVLWGDHGWHLGDHGMFCKHTNYEQAVKAPLIISAGRGAGGMERGAKTVSPSEFVDVFPTLCDLVGLPIPERVEGLSLVPILKNPTATVREASMSQYPRVKLMGYTLRDKRYRYVKWIENGKDHAARTGPVMATELYDYEKDPHETVNQANNPEYQAVVKNFERLFKERGVAQEK